MLETHIYIEIDSRTQRESDKNYGYILECLGKTSTKEGFGTARATYNKANLIAITEAIKRFKEPCEIHIHTRDEYVLNMIERCLNAWAENGFQNAKGKPVANQKEWMELWEQSQNHLLLTEPGEHSYSSWLQTQFKERTQNAK